MGKGKNKFKNSKIFISLTSIVSIVSFGSIVSSFAVNNIVNGTINSNLITNNNSIVNKNDILLNNNSDSQVKPLVPSVSNFENAKISTKQGPIVFWGDTIKSLDWFGAERWSIDLTKDISIKNNDGQNPFPTTYGTDVKRSWMNWEIDRKNNKLWILSNISNGKGIWNENDEEFKHQYLISLSTENGQLLEHYRLNRNNGRNDVYRNVSIFSDGSPFVYGLGFSLHRTWGGSTVGYTFSGEKLDFNRNKMISVENDEIAKKFPKVGQENQEGMDYFFNVIPIANNRNLFFTVQRSNIRSSNHFNNDKPFEKTPSSYGVAKMDMSITAILLDNNLKEINSNSDKWKGGNLVKIISSANDKFKNKYTFPQRDWYTLLDDRVVTIIYDTLLIFDPTNSDDPKYTTYKIGNDGDWVESYTFDTNEDIFFKLYNSTKIEKLTLDKNKNGSSHKKTLYYDLDNSSPEIKKHAKSFSIYNVSGYSGQIMSINSYFDGHNSSQPLPEEDGTQQYGLAAAITNNKSSIDQGDTKGLLNTEKAFQKSADFTIKQEVLNNKLPSEITRNDLDLLNKSFYTKRKETENGKLKYNPFVKTKMDDMNKELEVTVNLDQIPWFVTNNEMPNDIKPLTLKKTFNSSVSISSRFTWKNSDIDDYDFKNTLPSKVTLDDIKRISPLVSTLSSKVSTINGAKYPKTDYSIESQNDDTGKIKIVATYSYLPMDTTERENNIKTYKTEKEFNIFKSTNTKKFSFVKENNSSNNSSNIDNIPALKELKEANLFPSHFEKSTNKQDFIRFINVNNTSGYPLEKMNISVVADDTQGTLQVTVDPSSYDSSLTKQIITYTGLNKINSYEFSFNSNPNNFVKKNYRPSNITNEILFKHFVNYSGFDSSDLNVSYNPNDETGSLIVDVSLNVNYPEEILKNTGFVLKDGIYKQTQTISGFKTNNEFNNEYQITFKSDSDRSLIKIKELTPATIQAKIKENSLTVGGTTYKNIYELVNLFIDSKGTNIPDISETNKNTIDVQMFTNNSGGEISFSVTFKSLAGYANSITFIQKFTGFAKGNDVITDDVLTFKDSNQLKLTEADLFNKKPTEIKNMFNNENKNTLISKFLSGTPTGSYKTAIDKNSFTLDIIADDNYGTLTINIKFNRSDIANKNSLLEYSQTFEGFNHY